MTEEDLQAGDRRLAADLGWTLDRLYEVAGSGWEPAPPPREDNDDAGEDRRRWYIAGDPPQVMLGVSQEEPDEVLVARPLGNWGSWTLSFEPEAPVAVDAHDPGQLAARLAQVATSRRRSFRWCRYCRTQCAPEHRTEADVCSGCASVVQGVVF